MNYIGSKLSLLSFLEESIDRVVDKKCKVFCDLFAGTGIVGSHFKKKGYNIIANDIQYYSYVLNRHYIGNHKELKFKKLGKELAGLDDTPVKERTKLVCNYLSNITPAKGFIYNNYCLGGTKNQAEPRQYFSDENGMLCDAIRQKIENWKQENIINDDEYFFLVASLIKSADSYANTTSVYGAFLKQLKKSAQKKLVLSPAELIVNAQEHRIYNKDINKLISSIKGDILYLDPPYNHRQYATNYHLLETLAKYDDPHIHGKTGLREYTAQKSLFCSREKVKEAFRELMSKANGVRYIFLSYNNEGLMSLEDIKEIMESKGKYSYFTKNYNRYKADNNRNYIADKTTEYLHYVVCK